MYEASQLCVAPRRWHRTDKPLKRVGRVLRWASTFTAPLRNHQVVTARVLAPSASAHRQRGGTATPVAAAPGRKQMGGGRPHSLTASQPQPHSLLTAAASQPHTNSSSSGRGRRTQRQWRAGLPRATATAAGHSVAVVTGVGVMVVLRAPMKWSPPAAAGRWLRRALTPNQGTAALAGWPAGLVGLQGLLAEAWLGSRARRAHSTTAVGLHVLPS